MSYVGDDGRDSRGTCSMLGHMHKKAEWDEVANCHLKKPNVITSTQVNARTIGGVVKENVDTDVVWMLVILDNFILLFSSFPINSNMTFLHTHTVLMQTSFSALMRIVLCTISQMFCFISSPYPHLFFFSFSTLFSPLTATDFNVLIMHKCR